MASTPKSKRTLSCRRAGSSSENNNLIVRTPTNDFKTSILEENEDSPVFMTCTQEAKNDLDVIWDWNSPQSKLQPKAKQKRLILSQSTSPKFTLKRHPSNNKITDFDKIREELQALREQIAAPDNEDCLILSPLEEEGFKKEPEEHFPEEEPFPTPKSDTKAFEDDPFGDDDFFDCNIDQKLMELTQKVETLQKIEIKRELKAENLFDDSLDDVLSGLDEEKIIQSSQQVVLKSEAKNVYKTTEKVGSQQRKSLKTVSKSDDLPDHVLKEIERKRKEALAKIERKKMENKNIPVVATQPKIYTPEEIEKKRLEAIARRNAKMQQMIEQKRQEAIRKLQLKQLKQQRL